LFNFIKKLSRLWVIITLILQNQLTFGTGFWGSRTWKLDNIKLVQVHQTNEAFYPTVITLHILNLAIFFCEHFLHCWFTPTSITILKVSISKLSRNCRLCVNCSQTSTYKQHSRKKWIASSITHPQTQPGSLIKFTLKRSVFMRLSITLWAKRKCLQFA
jgi:hypothetical protein